jgi:hypothetical protein
LTGAGNGRFNLNPILATGAGLGWVSIADLNADGKDDIVVANGGRDTLDVYLAD